jgi:rubrerythrin
MKELEALKLAVEREKSANRFYNEAAARATNVNGKKMFTWLASEEMGHMKALEKQREMLKGRGKWLSEEGLRSWGGISEPLNCSEFPACSEVKGGSKPDAPELQVLKEAIEAERDAVSFYADLAKQTSNRAGKAMLSRLSTVEQGHLDLLEEEYRWLSRARDMFTIHRFSLSGE